MSRSLITADPRTRVSDAQRLARSLGVRHVLVMDSGRLAGLVCTCDLADAASKATLADCMRTPVQTIGAGATLEVAAHRMRDLAISCLPVRDGGGQVVGVITLTDLEKAGLIRFDPEAPRCAACGSRRHLRDAGEAIVCFCSDCLARGRSAAVEEGVAD